MDTGQAFNIFTQVLTQSDIIRKSHDAELIDAYNEYLRCLRNRLTNDIKSIAEDFMIEPLANEL